MRCIYHKTNDPFFNIASEEYFLGNSSDDIFILYINSPAVIVGKHQNTLAEIDYHFAQGNNISIVRRLSGGGAVYHDLGNLNFTFIRNGKEGALVDFKGFTQPIINLLEKLGVNAKFEGYNSLNVNGLKFSGNAEHVYKQRVMHHGTMLFSTNLQILANVLYVNEDRFKDRAVKSVRANTTNISDHLSQPMVIEEFADYVMSQMLDSFHGTNLYDLSSNDIEAINELVRLKYSTWDWNFGYSPSYTLERKFEGDTGSMYADVKVEKGIIYDLDFQGNAISAEQITKIKKALLGLRHRPDEVHARLQDLGFEKSLVDNLLEILF